MKRLLLIILATVLVASCGSQKALISPNSVPNHLRIEHGFVIWQKVYDGQLDQTALFRNLSGAGYFRDILETDGYVTCHLRPMNLLYSPLGFRHGMLPLYITKEMTAFITIQIKEDRYRVTVERMNFNLEKLGIVSLNDVAIKDHHPDLFKDSFKEEGPMTIINYNLGLIFDSLSQPRLTDEF